MAEEICRVREATATAGFAAVVVGAGNRFQVIGFRLQVFHARIGYPKLKT